MADEKVYYPVEIPDTVLPMQNGLDLLNSNGSSAGGIYTSPIVNDSPIPRKIVSHETIGASLNTKSAKIRKEYSFIEQGAILIGKYAAGVSGEIALTPNGIIAKNKGGEETVAIDGDTGDITVRGKIKAGDIDIVDEMGVVSVNAFNSYKYRATAPVSKNLTFSWEDVPNAFVNIVCERETETIISLFAETQLDATDTGRAYRIDVGISIDGATPKEYARHQVDRANFSASDTISLITQELIPPGIHTIQLRWAAFSDNQSTLNARGLDVTLLGN